MSLICNTLPDGSLLFWHTISPMRRRPKNASTKTHLNIIISYGDEQIIGKVAISFLNMSGVIGNLASGAPVSLLAPFRAVFTLNVAQGSDHPCTLCQLLIAHTYEFIVEGAFLVIDRNAQ